MEFSWNWFIWFHEFFWPGLFWIFWPTLYLLFESLKIVNPEQTIILNCNFWTTTIRAQKINDESIISTAAGLYLSIWPNNRWWHLNCWFGVNTPKLLVICVRIFTLGTFLIKNCPTFHHFGKQISSFHFNIYYSLKLKSHVTK